MTGTSGTGTSAPETSGTGTSGTVPEAGRSEPDLSYLLDHSGYVLRTRMSAALAQIDLTARMHCVLVHALGAERTQAELAEIGDMDKTTMVSTVDALERAGLARRRPAPGDRRARVIAVTDRGAQVAAESRRIVDEVHRAVLDTLDEHEREVLVRALQRLVTGDLAAPTDGPRPVRRARRSEV